MRLITTILASTLLSGCGIWPIEDGSNNLTVGAVQQSVYIGMSGAEVAMALGSPNIVSTDEFRNEVWIYDRFSTERVQTEGPDAIALLQSLVDGGGALGGTSSRQSESSSQKTLTVIIKFDEDGLVRDYAYHTSRF
jgi:outer membrane protein assembly factor BamE (lipoprotein component of BamABCDE complex)